MKEMQFAAIVLLTLMALTLTTLLPRRVRDDSVANHSRWLMTAGLALMAIQFVIQYITGWRTTNVPLAVATNLVFFIPAGALMPLNILNLLRQRRLTRTEWLVGVPTWIVAAGLLAVGIAGGGSRLLWAEIGASICYVLMQLYYNWLQLKEVSRMELVLADYYDEERGGLLWWMKISIVLLAVITVLVPLLIFTGGWSLAAFALFFFLSMYYLWFCFVRYVLTGASRRVREAEQSAAQEVRETEALAADSPTATAAASVEALQRADEAVARWIAAGGHLHSGTTKPVAAQEMHVPLYLLSAWLKDHGHPSYTRWMTTLRIDEAKRVLKAHPEWNVEAVADHCGISRTHFQRVFKQEVGSSPADFS